MHEHVDPIVPIHDLLHRGIHCPRVGDVDAGPHRSGQTGGGCFGANLIDVEDRDRCALGNEQARGCGADA